MRRLHRTITGWAARLAAVATTSAATALAVGLPIAVAGACGGDSGPIPVPRSLLAYLALLVLAPLASSGLASTMLALRLGFFETESAPWALPIIQIASCLPVLAVLIRFADVMPP